MLLFKPHHVPLILNDTKTETRRIWGRRRAVPGRVHKAKVKMLSKKVFARLLILDVFPQRLGDMTEADAQAEGGYTLARYRVEFYRINGVWDPDLVVSVVKFKRVGAR